LNLGETRAARKRTSDGLRDLPSGKVIYIAAPGDEMMIWCEGGPSILRRQTFPPALEIVENDGMYVLHDEGEPADWRYVFVGSRAS